LVGCAGFDSFDRFDNLDDFAGFVLIDGVRSIAEIMP